MKTIWIVFVAACGNHASQSTPQPPDSGNSADASSDSAVMPSITVEVVKFSGPGESLDLFPSVNAAGVIAYRDCPMLGKIGVYTDTQGTVATLAEITGPSFSLSSSYPTSINATGTVAFGVLLHEPDDWVLYRSGTNGPVELANTEPTSPNQAFFGIPAIGASGDVAFGAMRRSSTTEALLLSDGATTTEIATTGAMFARLSDAGGPTRDTKGDVAFVADRGGGHGVGLFEVTGGTVHLIAAMEDGLTVQEVRPALDDRGDVAFLASDSTQTGIFTIGTSGPQLLVADQVSGGPALAGDGVLAYVAIRPPVMGSQYGSEEIVLVPPGGTAMTVAKTEEALLGSTSKVLGLSPYGIVPQTNGYILVFGVQLADGRTVIERAHVTLK